MLSSCGTIGKIKWQPRSTIIAGIAAKLGRWMNDKKIADGLRKVSASSLITRSDARGGQKAQHKSEESIDGKEQIIDDMVATCTYIPTSLRT